MNSKPCGSLAVSLAPRSLWRVLLLLGWLGLLVNSGLAQSSPPGKLAPAPGQGAVSPSGKFIPATDVAATNALPPGSPAEAESMLKRMLRIQALGSNVFRIGEVEFDKHRRTITLPVQVCVRTQVVEYALVTSRGKAYESLFTTEAAPADLHLAFLLLGLGAAKVEGGYQQKAAVFETNAVQIQVTWQNRGEIRRCPLADLVLLNDAPPQSPGRTMQLERWLYNGSIIDGLGFAAQREGSIISLIRDPSALVNNAASDRDNDRIHFPNSRQLPPEGVPVTLILSLPRAPASTPATAPPWVSPVTPAPAHQP